MTGLLFLAAVALVVSICLSAFVQILYVESLRLRTRETPALEFFKETLEDRLGWKTEQGALAFALFKHTGLILLGIVFLLIASAGASQWNAGRSGAALVLHHVAGRAHCSADALPPRQRALAARG